MTVFIAALLVTVIVDVVIEAKSWQRAALGVVLALGLAALMMASHWDVRP